MGVNAYAFILACLSLTMFPATVVGLDNGLGRTPPLAWSSWNFFANGVNESVVLETADALAATGLAKLGYTYLNIDAGYLQHERDAQGNLVVNPDKFPHGMKYVGDALHAKGFKLGVYTDLSDHSCGIGPGSLGHYVQDAAQFASWGVDYLKVDYCGPSFDNSTGRVNVDPTIQYAHWGELRDALNKTGRPIYYSICPHTVSDGVGTATPFKDRLIYAPPKVWSDTQRHDLANSILVEYVNTYDVWYDATRHYGIITDIDAMVEATQFNYSAPGSWNDADMLQVCNYGKGATNGDGMTLTEYRAHYSVWAIFGSPLILGTDVRTLQQHPDCLSLLLNEEIIMVNQDSLGSPPSLISQVPATNSNVTSPDILEQIFARNLSNNKIAVVLLNRANTTRTIKVSLQDLGIPNGAKVMGRDIIAKKDIGTIMNGISENVETHDVSFLVLSVSNN
eukprot:m.9349 g.9349  ORF g.9349 m.9349 type:complete len:450 (+) comp4053_c0_seq1:62-1411(+)